MGKKKKDISSRPRLNHPFKQHATEGQLQSFKGTIVYFILFFFFVNRISVHAKQRQIHKNFTALRDKGLSVIQFADTPHVTRKLILEVLAHSWWLFVHSFIPWAVLLSGMATTVFFSEMRYVAFICGRNPPVGRYSS